jgi:DNA invertase Pin-like site-specific DNA recombinase
VFTIHRIRCSQSTGTRTPIVGQASEVCLEAQRAAVTAFLNGGAWKLLGEFVEVESGEADHNRPKLAEALATCRLTGATLLIAKMDRLSRDAHFLLGLHKAGVRFVAADNPNANDLTMGILAVVAQEERKAISVRTKAALAAAKARGVALGGYKGGPVPDAAAGGAAARAKADAYAAAVGPLVADMQGRGLSLRAIAAELTARGIRTPRDGAWSAAAVRAVALRAGAGSAEAA